LLVVLSDIGFSDENVEIELLLELVEDCVDLSKIDVIKVDF
jgi:hypothetical protein